MIKKWLERRRIRRRWEAVTVAITNQLATAPASAEALKMLYDLICETMVLYSRGNYISKQTVRLLFLLKRVLADKRSFDSIKTLEYLVAGHTIYKKRFMNREVRERLVAHCWQMVFLYKDLVLSNRSSNPFAPGQALPKLEE